MSVLLDTHVWVWWLTSPSPLSRREVEALDALAASKALSVSAISLWEVQMLWAKKRLELPVSLAEWLSMASNPKMVNVVPLDVDAVLAIDALPPSFHGDPADRVIVASARAHVLQLATRDSAIRRSRLVHLWKA